MKNILKWIITITVFTIVICTIFGIYQESKVRKGNNQQNNIQIERQSTTKNQGIEEKQNNENNEDKNLDIVPENYNGYKVAAELKIEKLNIDTYVLDNYTKAAMETCVTKFFGPEPNEVGNFCITGHNYITKNMFGYLYKLKVEDTFTLTDNRHGTIEYEIYDKYRVKPNDTYRIITKNKWEKRNYFSYLLQLL